MAFNWVSAAAQTLLFANIVVPGTDRHIKNWVLQQNTLLSEEKYVADIGNGKTVTVTIKDVIRKSGRANWDVSGSCSDGRSKNLVISKFDQPDKMKVADVVAQQFM
ncbi:unnamed protein product [Adineta steineri]|uniref:Uncharacterized protein n=1 Tax=Adineta steineri TaxID=433720 RepID=A0A819JR85_9BILA|nr:unnamed protein product [Adineta steineri]CAF1281825.1 unnamed protein product [Adineta steineri]CAF3933901.1 unnamed protein product [Adineta steineri]CAF4003102.1 unnamed protein product [Adineta steineri]